MSESIRPAEADVTEPRTPDAVKTAARRWLDEASAQQVMDLAAQALRDGDMKAAASLITVLALKDSDSAEAILAVVNGLSS
jgi:hypothetical protein